MQIFYTVQPGDTLFLIAGRWHIPLESLIAANRLQPPYTIFPGQQLSMPPGVTTYRVQPGDYVYRIAQRYRIPPQLVIEANLLRPPYILYPGQVLKIPEGVPYYVVQRRDTLTNIAKKYNVTPELIREANQLPSDTIEPGMKLLIPHPPTGEDGVIAYTAGQNSNFDIWLYDLRSGTSFRLTIGLAESFSEPFWSPDSTKIAFIGRNGIVYVVDLETETTARIDQIEPNTYLDWAPDNTRLSYVKGNQIVLYNVDTHEAQTLNQPQASDVQWFPSGNELLYKSFDQAGIPQLYRIQTDGTNKRQITQNQEGTFFNVRLSPDGTYALYTGPGVSVSLITTVNLATGEMITLQGGPLGKNYNPEWSPNSERIAYSATFYPESGYYSYIQTDSRRGGNQQTRAISDCFVSDVTWSPTGKSLAYISGCQNDLNRNEVWVVNLTHPVPVQILSASQIIFVKWSPSKPTPAKETFRSEKFRVSLRYPANWQQVSEERFEGPDGFFQIGAISSEDSLEEVCRNEAFHPLNPYGTNPQIINKTINGKEACYIYPSEDQPPEMNDQAAFITAYPEPVTIDGESYNYFILWADQGHIDELSRELRFL